MIFNRAVMREVLVYHQHTETSGCSCGWAKLGYSHADHVIGVYEDSMTARATAPRPR